jgi:hypothetical protein
MIYRRDGWQSPELDRLLRERHDLARQRWESEAPVQGAIANNRTAQAARQG